MSSDIFEVALRPDPLARRLVLVAGIAACATGLLLVASLHLGYPWRLSLGLVWLADCSWALRRLGQGNRRVEMLRLGSDGSVVVHGPLTADGAGRILTGTVVLPGLAWLRVALPDGSRHAELLIGCRAGGPDWHRFQLLWSQCQDAFGSGARA